ncbi:MAG: helix-turn-helix domain-containing protein, partial [Candidatus Brocadiaceae bacterium]
MGKVEDALRDLIYYHGKRAASEVLGNLPDQVREARNQLRELQRAVEEMAAEVKELSAARRRNMAVPPAEEEEVEKARFDKRTLKGVRRRFDLTQQELAELLEVSPVTVTSWETGKSRPRRSNLAQIVTLRSMDQKAVDEALSREHLPASLSPT